MQQMQLEGIPACILLALLILTTDRKQHRCVINNKQHSSTDQHPQLPDAEQHWHQAAAYLDRAGQDLVCYSINLLPDGSEGCGSKDGCSEGPKDGRWCRDVDINNVGDVLRPHGQCLHQTAVRALNKSHLLTWVHCIRFGGIVTCLY